MQIAARYRVKKTNPLLNLILFALCVGELGCASGGGTVTPHDAMQSSLKDEGQEQRRSEDGGPLSGAPTKWSIREPDFQSLGLQPVREEAVRNYLDRLREQLQLPSRLYAVKILNSSNRFSRYRPLSLPDTRDLVITSTVFSSVRYESELAAAISWEFERSAAGFSQVEPTFEPEDQIILQNDVLRKTVRRLYDAGFDPRGLVGFLEGYQNRVLASRWSIRKEKLNEWMKVIRAELAVLPPLLSPIVRSREFVELQTKVGKPSP